MKVLHWCLAAYKLCQIKRDTHTHTHTHTCQDAEEQLQQAAATRNYSAPDLSTQHRGVRVCGFCVGSVCFFMEQCFLAGLADQTSKQHTSACVCVFVCVCVSVNGRACVYSCAVARRCEGHGMHVLTS